MKKIMFLINTMCCGGAERALINIVSFLSEKDYDITVIAIADGEFSADLPSNIKYKPIFRIKNGFLRKVLFYLFYNILPKKLICRLFLNKEYDVAISFLEGLPTRILGEYKKAKRKFAFVHFGFDINDLADIGYKNKTQFIENYKKFSKVCFVSEDAKKCFTDIAGNINEYAVVHNCIDVNQIISKSNESSDNLFETNGIKLVTVGRLVSFKGHDRLIDIASRLEKKYDFELIIVGDGEKIECLREKIELSGVKSVKLVGYKDNPYPYIKQADIYVSSSLSSEGYNTAVVEALILNTPVVTTPSNGMEEILSGGKYGLITEQSDESLEKGIEKMLDNGYLEYKHNIEFLDKGVFNNNALNEYLSLIN